MSRDFGLHLPQALRATGVDNISDEFATGVNTINVNLGKDVTTDVVGQLAGGGVDTGGAP